MGAAFAAVLVLFGAALAVTLTTLRRTADAEHEVLRLDHAKHAGHSAAALVREQYIHQAHTIINWDGSHLHHYEEAVAATGRATRALAGHVDLPAERRLADEIARLAGENDRQFRDTIIPAIAANDRGHIHELHDAVERLASRVVTLNDELNHLLESRATAAHQRAAALRRQASVVILACFGLATALAAMVGFFLTRSIVRPISRLAEGARRVGAGDLSVTVDVHGADELAELARTFNQMTSDLGRKQGELVRSQKLASIGHVAAGVAHEINNPLGVIIGYTTLLRREPTLTAREEVQIIEDEARQCQRIVQGLLDLARPQQLDAGSVDLASVARDAVERLREAGKLDGISVEPPQTSAFVTGDEGRLRQVLVNVILNAADAASTRGGKVSIDAQRTGREVRISVRDSGPGIPAEILPRIFDPFFTTKPTGTGLGLSVAHAIIDAHGGRIEADSSADRGTTVAIWLPAAEAVHDRHAA